MKTKFKFLLLPLLSIALIGCDKGGKQQNAPSGGDNEPQTVTDYTVTETEFKAALNLKMKNLSYKAYQSEHDGEHIVADVRSSTDGSYYELTAFATNPRYWQALANGTYFRELVKNYEEDEWICSQYVLRDNYFEGHYMDSFGALQQIELFANDYNKLTYNAETHLYSGKVLSPMIGEVNLTAKFENKHLVSAKGEMESMGEVGYLRYEFFDYGSTLVDFSSLNIIDNFYISGRTFRLDEVYNEGYFDSNEAAEVFEEANVEATIIFSATDNSFTMHYPCGFGPTHAPETYSGTYEFDKVQESIRIVLPDGPGGMPYNLDADFNANGKNLPTIGVRVSVTSEKGFLLHFEAVE